LDSGAFDEPAGGVALVFGDAFLLARARLSSMSRMASQSSLTTASSLGKWLVPPSAEAPGDPRCPRTADHLTNRAEQGLCPAVG